MNKDNKITAILGELTSRYPALETCRDSIMKAYEIMKQSYDNGGKLMIAGNGGSAADSEHIVGELMKGFVRRRQLPGEMREALRAAAEGNISAADRSGADTEASLIQNNTDGQPDAAAYAQGGIQDEMLQLAETLGARLQGALPAIALTGHNALTTAYANDVDGMLAFAQQLYGYGKDGDTFLGISTSGNSKNVVAAALTAKAMGIHTIALTGGRGGRLKELCDCAIVVPSGETFKIQELHLPVYHALCLMLEAAYFDD